MVSVNRGRVPTVNLSGQGFPDGCGLKKQKNYSDGPCGRHCLLMRLSYGKVDVT